MAVLPWPARLFCTVNGQQHAEKGCGGKGRTRRCPNSTVLSPPCLELGGSPLHSRGISVQLSQGGGLNAARLWGGGRVASCRGAEHGVGAAQVQGCTPTMMEEEGVDGWVTTMCTRHQQGSVLVVLEKYHVCVNASSS